MRIQLTATEYDFTGAGISASYFPNGAGGPLLAGQPETYFSYHDTHQTRSFGKDDLTVTEIDDVAVLVTVPLVKSAIANGPITKFTVLIPALGVAEGSPPQSFKTKAITTVQSAALVARQLFGQLETYQVTQLEGSATIHVIKPLDNQVS